MGLILICKFQIIKISLALVRCLQWYFIEMFDFKGYAPGVDVSGLVAGIIAVTVSAIIATVLGIYFCKGRFKGGRHSAQ